MFGELLEQLEAARKHGDVEKRITILRQLLSLAQQNERKLAEVEILRFLGNAYHEKSDLQRSHAYRVTAEQLMREMGDDCPIEYQMRVEGDLGRSYIDTHDWEKAEEFTRRALEKAKSQNHEEGLCVYKSNLGLVLANTERRVEAHVLAEEVLRDAQRLGSHYIQGLQHLNLASLHLNALELNECQRHARKALAHAELSHDSQLRTQAQQILGESYRCAQLLTGRSEYSEDAEHHLTETLERARSQGNHSLEAKVELTLAELDESRRNFAEAAAHYQRAMEALESVRRKLGYQEMQKTYFVHIQPTYDKATEFLLRQGQTDDAFKTAERARSRMLLAMLGQKRRNSRSLSSNTQEDLKRELDRYGDGVLSNSPADVTEARRGFVRLYESQQSHTANWQSWQSPPIAEFGQIQQTLSSEEALLAYVVTDKSLVVFTATNESRHFQHLNYPREKLAVDVENLCTAIDDLQNEALDEVHYYQQNGSVHPENINNCLKRMHRWLEKLFAVLIAPILPVVQKKSHWVIVPQGPLHKIPWSALRMDDSYLVEHHSISLLPSASLGVALGTLPAQEIGKALFFGNPDSDNPTRQLPSAEKEVETAFKALNAGPAPFLGRRATKQALLGHVADAKLLHLACHHYFDAEAPVLSFLKLADNAGSDFIYSFELADMNLSMELVTLSACDTGLSRIGTGDEQYGMVRTFLASGTRSVLSTLWEIEDNSAAELFAAFYPLARKTGLAKALATAQRYLLGHPRYFLPNFWAPYVLSGQWSKPLSCLQHS